MATIELQPHNESSETWLLVWTERQELIGRVRRWEDGWFRITPHGPYWSPMKSFAGDKFDDPAEALTQVQVYFGNR
jgi:hypothetical protein